MKLPHKTILLIKIFEFHSSLVSGNEGNSALIVSALTIRSRKRKEKRRDDFGICRCR